MGLSYNQMVYFITVAETLNISDAAKQLYMTQPALGRQITALEKELNMQLFFRSTHGLVMTPAARYLKERWSFLADEIEDSVEQAKKISAGYSGAINIGILSEADATVLLGDRIAEFEKRYPNIHVRFERQSFATLRTKLRQRELDVIITYEMDIREAEGICYDILAPLRPAWAIPKRNHLYDKPDLSFPDFKNEEIVVTREREAGFGERLIIDDCKAFGGFYPKLHRTDTVEETLLAIETGNRCAIINMEMNIASTDKVRMVPLEHVEGLHYAFAWRSDTDNACIDLLRKIVIR